MSVLRATVLLLSVAACGRVGFDPAGDAGGVELEVAPPAIVDGTRLKAWYFGTGATQFFGGWHDTLLDIDCAFGKATDGVLRCQPSQWTQAARLLSAFPSFSDALCTQPSLFGQLPVKDGACLGPPAMAPHLDGIYALNGTTPSTPYLDGGSCQPFPIGSQVHFVLGAKIPDAMFVAATEQEWGTRRIHVVEIVAEDGTRQQGELLDTALGRSCYLSVRPGGVAECLANRPDDAAGRTLALNSLPTTIFADAACTEPAAIATATATPTRVMHTVAAPCGDRVDDEYDLGPEVPAGWAYGDGMCTPVGSGWRFYRVGPKRQTIVSATGQWTAGGADRLQDVTVTLEGGTQLRAGVFDTQLDTLCEPEQDDNATWRCMPTISTTVEPIHRAADCSDPAELAYRDCGAPIGKSELVFVSPQPSCRADGRHYRSMISAATPLYRGSPAGCVAVTEPMIVDSGSRLPATKFPLLDYRPAP